MPAKIGDRDGLNTGPASAQSARAEWDATPPTVEIGGVPAKINSRAALSVTFEFSEPVTGFVTGDVTVTGGTKGAFTGNGSSYTLPVTPTGSQDVVVRVAANAATDGLNTGPASAQSARAEWDATPPTVEIGGVPAKINSRAALSVTFEFSEPVTGFVTGDVTVTGGTKGAFTGNGSSYTLPVTPTGSQDVVVRVAANAATDGLNTGPPSLVSKTATWDATVPTLTIGGVPSKINATAAFTVTFTFSEPVTEFVKTDVTVGGGTPGAFAGNGTTYTLVVTPASGANVTVKVAAEVATDGVNRGPPSPVSATATWDASVPTVEIGGVPSKINSRAAFTVTFTFSEPVTEFLKADVMVNGGTAGAFTGSGTTYTLVVTPANGSNVTVSVAAEVATDGVNRGPPSPVSATATWDASVPTVEIDGVPARINSTTPLSVMFQFSEAVTDFVKGDVTVGGGTAGAFAGNGRSYTLVVTPDGSEDVVVTVAANSATDGLNTGPASAESATATWDATAPSVTIGGVPPRINSRAALSVTFAFSEAVTGFAATDVTVAGGTKSAFSGNGASYSLTVTPDGSADVVVTVEAGAATDGGGNTGPASAETATATWDATAPTVEITGVPTTINAAAAFTATFAFSEAVTDFVKGDVTVGGGTPGAFAGNGRSYTLVVTPDGSEDVVVTVTANSAADSVGNTGPASAETATATWDATAPTVEITGVPTTINAAAAFTATFAFSEAVTDFVKGDVTVGGGTAGAFAGNGRSYTLVVTPDGSEDVVVTVAANSATDGLNTGPASAESATATWDATAPSVTIGGVPPRINSRAALSVTFAFSEAVTDFVKGDVTVGGGTAGAFAGNGRSYTLVVTPDGSEDVVVTVAANSATDGLNTGPASAESATATWDATAPSVTIGGVPPRINSRAALSVTFEFSEAVTDFVKGDVTVGGGTAGAFAGNGRSYTLVVTPDGSEDVVVTVAANSATDGLNTGPASAESATATWDATAPSVTIGGVPPRINSRAALSVTFAFSEAVTGFAATDVTVAGGTKSAFAGNGGSYTLVVTPTGSADVVVTVAADAATDGGGNTGPASAESATAEWDAAAPSVTIGGVPPKINSRAALSVTFEFSEPVTDFVIGDVTVAGGTKGQFSGGGASYTLAVTPSGSADVVVTVAANAATDGLNTGPASAESATAEWDAAAPSVTIGGVPPKINSRAALSVAFEFSEAVTGFATTDVTVTGGTKSAFAGNGRNYTLAVTPAGSADVTVEVAANAATDGLNTGPASAESATAEWDAAAPSVTIGGVPPKINSRAALSVTFEFSEPVTDFVIGDVTVAGGTKGQFSGGGTSYTLAVTPAGSADVTVEVAANAATDGLNTGPASAESATAEWNAAAPSVTIGGVPAKINSRAALSVTFEFSEPVTGFATTDVTVAGGTKSAFSGNGSSYTLTVTPSGSTDVVVTVAANAATDGLNTGPASAESATATWDATAPSVMIGGVPARINSRAALSVTFEFSEAVMGFVTGDVTVTGGTKSQFSGGGASYTLAVTPAGSEDVTVEVAANAATDGVNTGPASAESATATWDAAAPSVTIGGVPARINSRAALSVTFEFSEAVTGFAATDVTVAGGTKSQFSGGGASYTLAVTPAGSADVTVTVAANSATDGTNTGPASAISATAEWDATAPTVGITGVPARINSTAALTATFTFSEAVTGFATGSVTVSGGTKGQFSGGGTTYTLAVTPAGSADVVVTVAANSATDGLNTGPASPVSATATWDPPRLVLSPTALVIAEGANADYAVSLATEPTGPVTVAITRQGDAALTLDRTSLRFTPENWRRPQTVRVTADADADENDARATLRHTASGGGYADVTADLPVSVNDGLRISIDDAEGVEGDYIEFRVHLSGPSPGGVRASWFTHPALPQTADPHTDYGDTGGDVIFNAGEQEKTVRVWLFEDDVNDPWETFEVWLTEPVGAILSDPEYRTTATCCEVELATGRILQTRPDPAPVEVSLTAVRTSVAEGGSVRVTATLAEPLEVEWSPRIPLVYRNGTAESGDYEGPTEFRIFFESGHETGHARIDIREDADADDETFTVSFGELPPQVRAGSFTSVEFTIIDDDGDSGELAGLTVSIADATTHEGRGDLEFAVTLNRPAPEPVSVLATFVSGTATRGQDFRGTGSAVGFGEGERLKWITVMVDDDLIDEGTETMTVELHSANPEGVMIARAAATGRIINSDPMPKAWLARFGRAVAEQSLEGITARIEAVRGADRTPGFRGMIAGQPVGGGSAEDEAEDEDGIPAPTDPWTRQAPRFGGAAGIASRSAGFGGAGGIASHFAGFGGSAGAAPRSAGFGSSGTPPGGRSGMGMSAGSGGYGGEQDDTRRRLLLGSSFDYTREEDERGGVLGIWGRGAETQFRGSQQALQIDGKTRSAMLGVDYARAGWLYGVTLIHSTGEGSYRSADIPAGDIDATLTAAVPYAAWHASDRFSVWGAAGYGNGELELRAGERSGEALPLAAEPLRADLRWAMAAAGLRSELFGQSAAGGPALAVISDVLWTRTESSRTDGMVAADAYVSRLRAGAEGSWTFSIDGSSITPKLEVGLRHDDGDAETGFGVEVGGGLAWKASGIGLSLEIEARSLVAHEAEGRTDRGLSAALSWSPKAESRFGPKFSLRQELGGQSSGGVDALFNSNSMSERTFGQGSEARWTAETSWGMPILERRFRAEPKLGYSVSGQGRNISLGWQFEPLAEDAADLRVNLRLSRRESPMAAPEHGIVIELNTIW